MPGTRLMPKSKPPNPTRPGDDEMSDEYGLVLAFPDQSPSFAHGFTCGRIWQQMSENKPVIQETVLAETQTTIEAMAMSKGWTEEVTDIGDGWLTVRLANPNA